MAHATHAARGIRRRRPAVRGGRASSALRATLATSPLIAWALILAGLTLSWVFTVAFGGAGSVVPHFYYVPILFAAVRFGPATALVVAAISGVLAGPLTPLDAVLGTTQDPERWLTRSGFFLSIGVGMSLLVRPSLPSITSEIRRVRDERAIRTGLERGEFFLRYQPIVELATGRVVALEALVRWRHPDHGELGPGAFLPAAEASDAIHDLGAFVLEEACRQQRIWDDHLADFGLVTPRLSINLSARELEDLGLVARVQDTIQRTGADASRICLELTETALAARTEISVARLSRLRNLGLQLAIDDFGTGYSSLSAVHLFPVDILKFDRSFLTELDDNRNTQQLLAGLELFARSLDLRTVVEGIETTKQRDTLIELGFRFGQGFLFNHALDAETLTVQMCEPGTI